jgi:hypothetical protein
MKENIPEKYLKLKIYENLFKEAQTEDVIKQINHQY